MADVAAASHRHLSDPLPSGKKSSPVAGQQAQHTIATANDSGGRKVTRASLASPSLSSKRSKPTSSAHEHPQWSSTSPGTNGSREDPGEALMGSGDQIGKNDKQKKGKKPDHDPAKPVVEGGPKPKGEKNDIKEPKDRSKDKKSKEKKSFKSNRPRLHPTTLTELATKVFSPALFPRGPPKEPPMYPPRGLRYSRLPPPCAEVDDAPTWRRRRWRTWDEVYSPLRRVVLNPHLRGQLRRHQTFTIPTSTSDEIQYPIRGVHRRVFPRGREVGMSIEMYWDRPHLSELQEWRSRRPKAWAGPFAADNPGHTPSPLAHSPLAPPATSSSKVAAAGIGIQPPLTPLSSPSPSPIGSGNAQAVLRPPITIYERPPSPKLSAEQRKAKREQMKIHKWILDIENERRWRAGMRRLMNRVYDFQNTCMLEPYKWESGKGVFLPDFDHDDVLAFADQFKAVRQRPDTIFDLYPDLGPVPGRAEAYRQIEQDEAERKERKDAKRAKAALVSAASPSPAPPQSPDAQPAAAGALPATVDDKADPGTTGHVEHAEPPGKAAGSAAKPEAMAIPRPPVALPRPHSSKGLKDTKKDQPKLTLEIPAKTSSPAPESSLDLARSPKTPSAAMERASTDGKTRRKGSASHHSIAERQDKPPDSASSDHQTRSRQEPRPAPTPLPLPPRESAASSPKSPRPSEKDPQHLGLAEQTAARKALGDLPPANPIARLLRLLDAVQLSSNIMPATAAAAESMRADLEQSYAPGQGPVLRFGQDAEADKQEKLRIARIMGALDQMDTFLELDGMSKVGAKDSTSSEPDLDVHVDDQVDDGASEGASSTSEGEGNDISSLDGEDGTCLKLAQEENDLSYRFGSVNLDDDTHAPSFGVRDDDTAGDSAAPDSLDILRPRPPKGVMRRQTMA